NGNAADHLGGGIAFASGSLSGGNVTVSGNTGWGVALCPGSATFTSSTITDNSPGNSTTVGSCGTPLAAPREASAGARGVLLSATVRNTLIANPRGALNCAAPLLSRGFNLSSDASCGFAAPGDRVNADARLGPLTANGGAVKTHALLPGSA